MRGHVRKRGGIWYAVVSLGRDPRTGKRRSTWRRAGNRKRDAEALVAQLVHQVDTGSALTPGRVRLSDFLEQWLAAYVVPSCRPATVAQYQWAIRKHITPRLGSIALTKLRPGHVQQAYGDMQASGLSGKSVQHVARVLREALSHGVKWQLLATNPADAATPPRPEVHEPPVVSVEASQRILSAAEGTRLYALVHTLLWCGLRRGEAQGLRWDDITFDGPGGAVLSVRQAAQWLPGRGWEFVAPKTDRARRQVALSPASVEILKAQRTRQLTERLALGAAYGDRDLVFASQVGTPIPQARLRAEWNTIAAKAGLPSLTLHGLRHAHASLLLASGANIAAISERLGHASPAFTMSVYAHLLPHAQREAVQGLDRFLAASGGTR